MEKLAKIQRELKAPKNQFNSFGKYKYRSCEDILEAVKPLLDGAILTLSDEMVEVGGRVYVKATATFKDGDFSIFTTAYAREPEDRKGMDASQITGTASSYSRKYSLNGLLLIDDTKDADDQDSPKQQKPPTTHQNAPESTREDVGHFDPPEASKTTEDTEKQLITTLKRRIGAKMVGMSEDERLAMFKWVMKDKKETVDALQHFYDKYDDYTTNYEFSKKG